MINSTCPLCHSPRISTVANEHLCHKCNKWFNTPSHHGVVNDERSPDELASDFIEAVRRGATPDNIWQILEKGIAELIKDERK